MIISRSILVTPQTKMQQLYFHIYKNTATLLVFFNLFIDIFQVCESLILFTLCRMRYLQANSL